MQYARLANSIVPTVDIATWAAIIAVESSGSPVDPATGKVIIRFENHIFFDRWGKHHREYYAKHFSYSRIRRWEEHKYCTHEAPGVWKNLHVGRNVTARQTLEHEAQKVACQMDATSTVPALESASYGMGQIMGFNYAACGLDSVHDLVRLSATAEGQVELLTKFVVHNPRLLLAAEKRDWTAFAGVYNGNGQVEKYSKWLAEAYSKATYQLSTGG